MIQYNGAKKETLIYTEITNCPSALLLLLLSKCIEYNSSANQKTMITIPYKSSE